MLLLATILWILSLVAAASSLALSGVGWIALFRRREAARAIARTAGTVSKAGLAFAFVGALAMVAGTLDAVESAASHADGQSFLALGLAESAYNTVFTVLANAPALAVALLLGRRVRVNLQQPP